MEGFNVLMNGGRSLEDELETKSGKRYKKDGICE